MRTGAAPNTRSLDLVRANSEGAFRTDADKTNINVPGAALTMECWINIAALGVQQVFAGVFDFANNEESFVFYYASSAGDQMRFRLESPGGLQDFKQWSLTPSIGAWEHWAVTWAGTHASMSLYRNGVSQGAGTTLTNNNIGALKNSTAPWVVGAFGDSVAQQPSSDFYGGLIDEVRLWHVTRTQPQIAANMSQQLNGNEPGLVAYYRFNNDLLDRTANANHLTGFNGPGFSVDVPFP